MSCDVDYKQVMFLGCTVRSFGASIGWNEQASTVSIDLVQDDCAPIEGTKIYYDIDSKQPIEYNQADPGYLDPSLGSPCFFKYGRFEFTGLLSNIKRGGINTNKNLYTVTLTSPVEILKSAEVILGEYAGEIFQNNVFNVYGALEKEFGIACTTFEQDPVDGPIFGSTAGGYGGAGRTDAGLPWPKVRQKLVQLTSSIPTEPNDLPFSPNGRIRFPGGGNGGFGLLPADVLGVSEYTLDFSEIPVSETDIRIAGSNADILSIVSQVCQEFAHDYFIELVYSSGIKIIKFRTVSRIQEPPTGQIAQFIDNLSASSNLVNAQYGQELRSEIGSKMLIGGQKRSMYQVDNGVPLSGADPDSDYIDANFNGNQYLKDTIVPYYGKSPEGDIYYPIADSVEAESRNADGEEETITYDKSYINIDLRILNDSLSVVQFPSSIKLLIKEIQAAQTYSSWYSYTLSAASSPLGGEIGALIKAAAPGLHSEYDRSKLIDDNGKTIDHIPAFTGLDLSQAIGDCKKIYRFIAEIYQNSQTKVMVRIPYTCAKLNSEEQEVGPNVSTSLITSDQPAPGGWTETSAILSLPNPGGIIDYFKNEDGTIPPLASFRVSPNSNFSGLGDTKYYYNIIEGVATLFVQVGVNDEIEFLDRNLAKSPRVILDIPNVSSSIPEDLTSERNNRLAEFDALSRVDPNLIKTDELAELIAESSRPLPPEPIAVAIPFVSNEITYGPWIPDNISEEPGPTQIEKNDTLVPWTYGSYANMQAIAQVIANSSVANMRVSENGSVTVPAAPTISLGEAIQSVGPNLTALTVNAGADGGINTTYTFRTYAQKFGILSKYNANELSNRLSNLNKFNAKQRLQDSVSRIKSANVKRIASLPKIKLSDKGEKGVVEEVLEEGAVTNIHVGSVTDVDRSVEPEGGGPSQAIETFNRPGAATKSFKNLRLETSNDGFDSKAIMSDDGFYRPVSLTGGGGLPRLAKPKITGVNYDGESGPETLTSPFFNFLMNPSATEGMHTGDTGTAGHDIQVLARRDYAFYTGETGVDTSYTLTMPNNIVEGENITDYTDDYRFFALRGPLMMQGWGYDLNDKPIPNAADEEGPASSGDFTDENLTNQFLPNWLQKSKTWPVAPIDLRFDRDRGVWTTNGGGGADNGKLVRIYDDLDGFSWQGISASPNTARALPIDYESSTFTVNTGTDFIDIVPIGSVKVELSSLGCDGDCDAGGTDPLGGIYINMPVNNANYFDVANNQLRVSGGGGNSGSKVELEIVDGSSVVALTGVDAIPVGGDGSWASGDIDISSLMSSISSDEEAIEIRARESFLGGQDFGPVKRAYFTGFKDRSSFEINSFINTPVTPPVLLNSQLNPAGGTVTNQVSPVFRVETDLLPDLTGPIPVVYINGNVYASGQAGGNAWSSSASGGKYYANISGTTEYSGNYVVTYTLTTEETSDYYEGGHSPPTFLTVDPDAANEDVESQSTQYAAHGWVVEQNGVNYLTQLLPCPTKITVDEQFLLTGTGLSNNNGVD